MNLKQLQNLFDKLVHSKYTSKKDLFASRIAYWKEHGYDDLAKKADTLLVNVGSLIADIRAGFNSQKPLIKELAAKIKSLKKALKELNEITKPEWRQWIEALLFAGVIVFVLRNYLFGLYHVPTGSAETNLLVGDRVLGNKLIYRVGYKPSYGDLVMFDDPNFKFDKTNSINNFWQKYVGFGIPLLGLTDGPQNLVKRVIAVPGDTVEGRIENGRTVVYRNGELLDEPYLNELPLIGLEKRTGFFDFDRLGFIPIPSFLQKQSRPVFYTYDPMKDFSDQPYYNMSSEEVLLEPGTLRPWLKFARTPTKNQYGRVVDVFGPITLPAGKYWVMGDSRKNSQDSRFWGMLDDSFIHGRASFILYSVDSEEPLWIFELLKNPFAFWTKSVRWNRFFTFLSTFQNQKKGEEAPKELQEKNVVEEKSSQPAPATPAALS